MKDIPGYDGLYAVTEDGKVWSYAAKSHNPENGKWLKQQMLINKKDRNKPHKQYIIGLYKDKKRQTHLVHRLIALTYISNPENKLQINHKDGNPLKNYVDNLEWVTASENIQHGIKLGLIDNFSEKCKRIRSENGKKMGAINGMKFRRLFSFAEANCIRAIRKATGKSCDAIARIYGCAPKTINNIVNLKSYLFDI